MIKNIVRRGRMVTRRAAARAMMEALEPRQLFSLIGVLPDLPVTDIQGPTGSLSYTASTHSFDVVATPIDMVIDENTFASIAVGTPKDFQLHISVDGAGNATSGSQADDLVLTGSIDVDGDGTPDYSGTLLTGKVEQFGYLNSGTNDAFDFRFHVTGGVLAAHYFANKDLGLLITSENSTFDGTFSSDFTALTKGSVGAIPQQGGSPLVISGHKFQDITGNGQSSDDTPLPGVTIKLYADTDGNGQFDPANDAFVTSAVTDSSGAYSFVGLAAGTYFVAEAGQPGYTETGPASGSYVINGVPGGTYPDNDFDNFKNIIISGTKFNDLTGNGFGTDDTPLAGVTINLFKNGGTTAIATTVTGGDGTYSFSNLGPGSYTVQEELPAGWVQTGGVAGYTIIATSGINSTSNNFDDYRITTPNLVTAASFSSTNIVGSAIPQDTAVLSGGHNETGTLTFKLFAPDGSIVDTETVTPNGDGTYGTSNTHIATQVGTYKWTVSYAGDNFNFSTVDQGGPLEMVTTVKASPAIVTQASETNAAVGIATLSDTATISGAYHGTGSITFVLKNPAGNTVSTQVVTVNGNGNYTVNTSVLATLVGMYQWSATYSGDSLNNGAVDNGVNESLTVTKASPTLVTTASLSAANCNWVGAAIPQDKAVLSGGYNESGTITFVLKAPDGTIVDTETVAVHKDGTYSTNNSIAATQTGTYTWSATYSGDTLNNIAKDQGGSDEQISIVSRGTISGHKFLDTTGNGLSSDDTALAGVTIQLYNDANGNGKIDSGDKVIDTETTSSGTGAYAFTGLAAGHYIVTEVNPSGYVQTGPVSGQYAINLKTGSTSSDNDFDDYKTDDCVVNCISYVINGCKTVSDISGQLHQGDVVTVTFTLPEPETISFVSYTAPDSYFDANDASEQKIFDLDSKTYTAPGTYSLTVVVPNCDYQVDLVCGYAIDTLGPAGSNIFYSAQSRLHDSDNGGTNCKQPTITTCNGTGTISGCVFSDENNDGKKCSTDCGIGGTKVTCVGTTSNGGCVILSTTCDSNGNYKFCNLPSGTYKVIEHDPDGYYGGKNTASSCGGSICGDICSNIVLSNGRTASGCNFGELQNASISGAVYGDKDKDGRTDSNEHGIANVKIVLSGTNDLGQRISVTTYTDANGQYSFDNLRAGTYTLAETEPSGYSTTRNTIGTEGGRLSGDSITSITLGWTDDATGYNFGDYSRYA